MTMPDARSGGLAAWAPRAVPGPGIELTPAQELAIALRHLDDVGWCENLTGHITVQQGDEFLVNPWGLWWAEVRAHDLLTIDADGAVLVGEWDVTPAVHIHTELHRRRADAAVVVHNHPPYASALAAIGELPDLVHQNSSILADELVLVTDYDGEVDKPALGAELAEQHRRRVGRVARQPRRDRDRTDDRGGRLQVGAVRAHVHAALARAADGPARRSRSRRRTRSS